LTLLVAGLKKLLPTVTFAPLPPAAAGPAASIVAPRTPRASASASALNMRLLLDCLLSFDCDNTAAAD